MIKSILVAVDDTPAALAGARFGVQLAATLHAEVHVVAVVPGPPSPDLLRSAGAVLEYAQSLGREAEVPVHPTVRHGDAAPCILAEIRRVAADVVVLGRSGRSGLGQPYIGSQTREVLEFAEVPVIVVPPGARDRRHQAAGVSGSHPRP